MVLEETLEKIQNELAEKYQIRQKIQTEMRKAIRLSKQGIFFIHKKKIQEASSKIGESCDIISNMDELTRDHAELSYMGIVDSALQEYAEAKIFLSIVKSKRIVDNKEIGVPPSSYILGLADVIGELRRRALDQIRNRECNEAVGTVELMEELYVELVNHDELMILVQGLRRKLDVARHVIEATRGDTTNELRRSSLENSISELKIILDEKTERQLQTDHDTKRKTQ